MYFITTKRMLEVCFFQHTPTFIIEPFFLLLFAQSVNRNFFLTTVQKESLKYSRNSCMIEL